MYKPKKSFPYEVLYPQVVGSNLTFPIFFIAVAPQKKVLKWLEAAPCQKSVTFRALVDFLKNEKCSK